MGTEKKVTSRAAILDVQKVEDWINAQEDAGQLLVSMGFMSDEEYELGIHQLEDFRVKLEANPENIPADPYEAFKQAEGVSQIGERADA